ncbi:hypothetical protein [Alicyclobacillus acidoterrestris]|uniref:Uncharacterized protein n=1 Tax=Alicyclobacillus acidoterrestris (strain ATCC 49025 / DSM 3922 / CIP 106132 / NCIMB 13137 / GD3B) TaxID=1356854 RepID=T0C3P7_ALIAG|nr:hypothetical protein [Alicyclobacillus acidoterrestris]EPZ47614.1 hypothetical protein N007_04985 [Alicyclobacillus acidoterrestris ATCC 49025]UNO48069.1 hypothetical protein K1I37_15455 [Alicyclobacillus acidoterrestris]
MTIVASVVNDAVVLFGVAGTLLGFSKTKWFQASMTFLNGEKGEIEKGVEALIHTPIAKTIEAKLHHELSTATDDLKKSVLAQYALAVIHVVGKTYDELSPSEQAAAIAFIKAHLPKNVEATEKEIVQALKDAPDIAKLFADDPAFKKAQEFTQLLDNANKQDTQPAPAPETAQA